MAMTLTQQAQSAAQAEQASQKRPTQSARGGQTFEDNKVAEGQQLQLVTFEVGKEEFGISILDVQEINRMLQMTSVPESPEEVVGVVNLRGRIIPVVDLRCRFGFPRTEATAHSRIIVVNVDQSVIGFIVDKVNEVLRISSSVVEPPPAMVAGEHTAYLKGVGKLEGRLLMLLDLRKLFSKDKFDEIQQCCDQ